MLLRGNHLPPSNWGTCISPEVSNCRLPVGIHDHCNNSRKLSIYDADRLQNLVLGFRWSFLLHNPSHCNPITLECAYATRVSPSLWNSLRYRWYCLRRLSTHYGWKDTVSWVKSRMRSLLDFSNTIWAIFFPPSHLLACCEVIPQALEWIGDLSCPFATKFIKMISNEGVSTLWRRNTIWSISNIVSVTQLSYYMTGA